MEYIRLKDVTLSTQYGYTAEETSKTDGVYKYLRITDIVPYFVDMDTVPYCSIPQKKVDQYLVKEGDILIARTGATTGYNYVVPKGIKNTVYASYLIRFNVDKSKILPSYLKYVLKSGYYYGFVNNYIGGSAQPGMNARVFGRFNLPYNTIPTQRRIASILSAYDNLIENNNRRIRLLEQMAENLYKEWFVRFRFSGHEKVEMENGVPKGWFIKKLGTFLFFERGVGYGSKDIEDGENVLLSMNNIRPYGGFIRDYSRPYSGKFRDFQKVKKGELIMSITDMTQDRRIIGYTGIVPPGKDDRIICTHLIKISSAESHSYFLNAMFNYSKLSRVIAERATGANVLGLTADILKGVKWLVPPVELQSKYVEKVTPIIESIFALEQQNDALSKQRDLLLPRLMSGKLEVNVKE